MSAMLVTFQPELDYFVYIDLAVCLVVGDNFIILSKILGVTLKNVPRSLLLSLLAPSASSAYLYSN